MLTIQFWKDLTERSLKTAAQFVLVAVGGNLTNVWDVDWKAVAGAAAAGAFTSVMTSLISLPIGSGNTASMTKAVEAAPDDAGEDAVLAGKHAAPE